MEFNIEDSSIVFYNKSGNRIMVIDYSIDECICFFYSNDVVEVDDSIELYNFMNQKYLFSTNDFFHDYKDSKLLIWHSDCYYNSDDLWSVKLFSKLNIKFDGNKFMIWCVKPLDEMINRNNKTHAIGFSPLGNGRYSKNVETNSALQDDFVRFVYQLLRNLKINCGIIRIMINL